MRFATLKDKTPVLVHHNGLSPLSRLGFSGSLLDLIQADPYELHLIQAAAHGVTPDPMPDPSDFDAPYYNPGKLIAIGLNYVDHAAESNMELPKTPLLFTKFNSSITGPTDPVRIPEHLTSEVDYEVELGVVIGKTASNVSLEDALTYVFGYTIINDVSARDIQFADKQWVRGKSLDTFCPMGPIIVTADEIPDPQNIKLGCQVNGVDLQNDTTKNMIFGVAVLVSELSKSFTLHPGDIIATGTPAGVGFSRKPPVYLRPGDSMRTWIENIGELNNPIVPA
jgi:2-keto-4-pentenoate hydratase/2-oxohepta-3-ene-1,7-dioic acid hydratase in catechol pathway